MSLADLSEDLKTSLNDAAEVFAGEDDMARLLGVAALDFNDERPRTLFGEVQIQVGNDEYPAPAGLYRYKSGMWGRGSRVQYWDPGWPGVAPDFQVIEKNTDAGAAKVLRLDSPATHLHINAYGAKFGFYYLAAHHVDDDAQKTTISAGDRGLLILRAQAEAMRELTMRNIKKPVQLRDGLNSAPRNMSPAAFYDALMKEWQCKVRRLSV